MFFQRRPPIRPMLDRHFPERVFWGDTHLHTSFSMERVPLVAA